MLPLLVMFGREMTNLFFRTDQNCICLTVIGGNMILSFERQKRFDVYIFGKVHLSCESSFLEQ